jgi:hypothetical protein
MKPRTEEGIHWLEYMLSRYLMQDSVSEVCNRSVVFHCNYIYNTSHNNTLRVASRVFTLLINHPCTTCPVLQFRIQHQCRKPQVRYPKRRPNAFVCLVKCPSRSSSSFLSGSFLVVQHRRRGIYGSVMSLTLLAVPPTAMRVCR